MTEKEKRVALIIANYEYGDAGLQQLVAPAQDAGDLARVLGDASIGNFEATILINQPSHEILRQIATFFTGRSRDELLLLYFSGHGVKDDAGRLYLATSNTELGLLRATAVPTAFINDTMDDSRSRRQVLILDCCYSGAFGRGRRPKAGESINTGEHFEGRGRVVLTASNATQYSFEGDEFVGQGVRSVFTRHLVRGLETGEADRDGNGRISLDELYDYVYKRVTDEIPQQVPTKWVFDMQGDIIIAKTPHLPSIIHPKEPDPTVKPVELPTELREGLEDNRAWVREGAINELGRLLYKSDAALKKIAYEALQRLKMEDDSRRVIKVATEILEKHDRLVAIYDQAQAAIDMKDWSGAQAMLEELVAVDAEFRDAARILETVERHMRLDGLYKQAQAAKEAEDWPTALAALEELVTEDAEFKDAARILEIVKRQMWLDGLYDQAQTAIKVEDWPKALDALGQLVAEDAKFKDAASIKQAVEREAQLADLYQRAQAAIDAKDWRGALAALTKLVADNPDYKDATDTLERVKKQVRLVDLYDPVEQLYQDEKWQEVITAFDQIKVVEPDYGDPEALLSSARYHCALEAMNAGYCCDPLLQWEGGFPYVVFSEIGVSPASSMKVIRDDASYKIKVADRPTLEELRFVDRRLFVDAFLYPITHWKRAIQYLKEALAEKRALPSPAQLQDVLEDDAPVILLLMGERNTAAKMWEELQYANPTDGNLAFKLALLYYWWTKDRKGQSDTTSAQAKWKQAIGNWVIVLEDDVFWKEWGEKRSKDYEERVTEEHLSGLRQKLEEHFRKELTPSSELSLAYQNELAAVRLLEKAGGLPTPERASEKAVCGPLMLSVLNLEAALSKLIAYHSAKSADIVEQLERMGAGDWSPRRLRRYFSQFGSAVACLERDQPEAALAALEKAGYGSTPKQADGDFDRRNPAYAQLPHKRQVLLKDAQDIVISAHLHLAETHIARKDPAVDNAEKHWSQAITFAKEMGNEEQVRESVRDTAAGRIKFIAKEADQDGQDITWCNQIVAIGEAAIEVAGPGPDLVSRLAQALTFRGVRQANSRDIVGAEKDLRKAFEFNPAAVRTRHQFSLALELLADKIEDRDKYTAAQLLRESEKIVREGLEDHPEHQGLKKQLADLVALRKPQEPTPAKPVDPDDPIKELRDMLGLPSIPDETPKTIQDVEAHLKQTDLKFTPDLWQEHTFKLPFHSEIAPDVVVRLQVEGDIAVISSRLPAVVRKDERRAFLNLLQATCQVPLHKFCRAGSGESSIVAEVPAMLLKPDLLEIILRMTSNYVDVEPRTFLSLEQLKKHFEMEIMARRVVQPLEWLEDALNADPLPSLCRARSIACQALADGRYSIRRGRPGQDVVAHYTDTTVHFVVIAGPLKKKGVILYRRMAEINASVRLCKVALDPQQNVLFMVELPGLNEETLVQALDTLEKCTLDFGAELVK